MQIRIGLENNVEGRSLAWVLDYPGCFEYGADEAEALIRLPRAMIEYEKWIKDHTSEPWVDFTNMDMRVIERFETFRISADFRPVPAAQGDEINAWFVDDWRPLTVSEVNQALKIFRWQRDELLAGLSTLDPDILAKERPGQRWNIWGIVKHIANAELWYLSRLELSDLSHQDLLSDPVSRLDQTSALIYEIFPTFPEKVHVAGKDGEFWSFRKLVRRTLWHQKDHIEHIKQLVFNENS